MVPDGKDSFFSEKRQAQGQKPVDIAFYVKTLSDTVDVAITSAIR